MIKSGIYKIQNKINGKCYVGSAVDFKGRFASHKSFLRKNIHPNKKLQHSWNFHGPDAFLFLIVENVPKEDLIQREQFWIDSTNVVVEGYNICPNAGSTLGVIPSRESIEKSRAKNIGRKNTLEAKKRMSEARRGVSVSQATRDKISATLRGRPSLNIGRKHTDETRKKISLAATGRKASEETIQKMSASRKGRKQSPETIKKSADSRRGKKRSQESKDIMRASWALLRKGKPISQETRDKMSASRKGKSPPARWMKKHATRCLLEAFYSNKVDIKVGGRTRYK